MILLQQELNDETGHSNLLDGQINVDSAALSLPNGNADNNGNDLPLLSSKVDSTKHESGTTIHLI